MIDVKYKFDEATLDQISASYIRGKSLLRFAPIIGCICLILGSCLLLLAGTKSNMAGLASKVLTLAIFSVLLFILPWLNARATKRGLRASSLYNRELAWQINDQILLCESSDAFQNSFKWTLITKITETAEGFLLHTGLPFYWLPKNGFKCNEEVSDFKRIARDHVVAYSFK